MYCRIEKGADASTPLYVCLGLSRPQAEKTVPSDKAHLVCYDSGENFETATLAQFKKDIGNVPSDNSAWHLIVASRSMETALSLLSRCPRSFSTLTLMDVDISFDSRYRLFNELPVYVTGESGQKTAYFLKKSGFQHIATGRSIPSDEWISFLHANRKQNQLKAQWEGNGLWSIYCGEIDGFYLLDCGAKALLIDTGSPVVGGIMGLVRQLTDKSVSAIITHGHIDHFGNLEGLDEIWYPQRDRALLEQYYQEGLSEKTKVNFIQPGVVIQVGNRSFHVEDMGGHTAGSIVLVDLDNRQIFSGDAFGSGTVVLIVHPYALDISEYRKNLMAFHEKYSSLMPDAVFWGGHTIQESDWEGLMPAYHPLCWDVVTDMIALCDRLLGHEDLAFEPFVQMDQEKEKAYKVSYGSAAIVLTKSKIR